MFYSVYVTQGDVDYRAYARELQMKGRCLEYLKIDNNQSAIVFVSIVRGGGALYKDPLSWKDALLAARNKRR
jgi:hypothetical protein